MPRRAGQRPATRTPPTTQPAHASRGLPRPSSRKWPMPRPRRPRLLPRSCPPSPAPPSPAPSSYASSGACDPDAAYDPDRPCQPLPPTPAPVVAQPLSPPLPQPAPARRIEFAAGARPLQERMARSVAFTPGPPPGRWAIQVGAFANLATAQGAAETARSAVPDILRTAKIELPATTPFGRQVAFRARLFGLSQSAAADACARLTGQGTACMIVPPPHDSF